MQEKLKLKIPTLKTLYFKKEIKEDPFTMDYNAGYDVNFEGYNYSDGTIKTNIKELKNVWYKRWVHNWPTNYYAYIAKSDNTLIGEIYAKWVESKNAYEIGIVIKGEYRGNGYSTQAIGLLIKKLKSLGAKKLYHEVPTTRKSAIQADINNGFIVKDNYLGAKKFGKEENITYLEFNLKD